MDVIFIQYKAVIVPLLLWLCFELMRRQRFWITAPPGFSKASQMALLVGSQVERRAETISEEGTGLI